MIDAHQHFWDPGRREYPWMGDELAPIRRRFGPEELRPVLAANGIEKTILVQTVSSLDETKEFLRTAEAAEFVAGVVGWIDLTGPDVGEQISSLRDARGGSFLKGIRHQVQDEPDPNWLLRDDVQRGLSAVGEAGLIYDLLVRPRELPAATEAVRRNPDVQFVLDHGAKPRISAGKPDVEWETHMEALSDLPNVVCKLSGLVTEADWQHWALADIEPFVKHMVDWFGAERCMFGSDWPVCLLAASYDRVAATMRELIGPNEHIFGGTARRIYRLQSPA